MTDWGVTSAGFRPKALSDVQSDIEAALQQSFGNNINLASESVFGQFVATFSEQFVQLWQLGQAVYNANNPASASGVSVDNILALNNLQRLPARATVTAPQPATTNLGIVEYGLVLFGTPGTIVPAGALISAGAANSTTFALDAAVTIGAASNARQTLTYSNQPNTGYYALTLTDVAGDALTIPYLSYGQQVQDDLLIWPTAPTSGTFTLTLNYSQPTAAIPYSAAALDVQNALQKLTGYGNVQVSGSVAAGMIIHFSDTPTAIVNASGAARPETYNSVQAYVNTLTIPNTSTQPFSDCSVVATSQGLQFDFGGGQLGQGQTSCAAMAVPLIAVSFSNLARDNNVTALTILEPRVGAPAQGIGSATASVTGPTQVLAHQLTTIITPQAGWTGVDNQLDCGTGADIETDSAAIARFDQLRSSQGSGSLAAVIERVLQVAGVTSCIGFSNPSNAAQQVISLGGPSTQGSYQLATSGGQTGPIVPNAAASDVQAALAALPQLSTVQVTGSPSYGYVIDFAGAQGGQAQPLVQVLNNTTGVTVTPSFGRPPHSVEIVATGGADADIAAAVLAALPAGMSSYGAPVVRTTGTISVGSQQLVLGQALGATAGLAVTMAGIPLGAQVSATSGNVVTLSAAALSSQSNVPVVLSHAPLLADSAGNQHLVAFSRPTPALVYISLDLITDRYLTPGIATSGINAASQWDPSSVSIIQDNLLAIGAAIPVGGRIVTQGTNGLVGSFNQVAGIVDFTLAFDIAPNPTNTTSLKLQPTQAPSFQASNVSVSYT